MSEQPPARNSLPPGAGVVLGIAIGVALGAALNNLGAGVALGVALGAGWDIARNRRANKDDAGG
jgi:F0F1-type ATP synthase membrane subunit c/vacuolar-type H+-ATPase subunit K